jgi:hypothetical protein
MELGFSNPTYVYENGGAPNYVFRDRFDESGIEYYETHTDPALVDFDNDGHLDLSITSVYDGMRNFLYRNTRNRHPRFVEVESNAGFVVMNGWGHAWADYNRDGLLDCVVCTPGGSVLLQNHTPLNNWLQVKLTGTASNRDAIGARVLATTHRGTQMREVTAIRGYGSQDEMTAHFGFGNYSGDVSVEVRWPSGHTTKHRAATGRSIQIAERSRTTRPRSVHR